MLDRSQAENGAGPEPMVTSTSTETFLSELRSRDVRCWMEGGRLRLSAPREALTPELHAEVARRKDEILWYLRSSPEVRLSGSRIAPAPREGDLPLSFAQERLWFLQKLDPGSAAYNLQANIRIEGALHLRALEQALAELARRHEPLRTRFETRDGRPVQVIARALAFDLPVTDLAPLGEADRIREAMRLASAEARRPFDLERGPVVRVLLMRLRPAEHELLVTQHHIVTDGWSIALLVEEVLALYRAFAAGRPSPLPESTLQYADFAAWQRSRLQGEELERELSHWRKRLRDAPPVLDLPTDRPRPAVQTTNGANVAFELPGDLSEGVAALARAEGATVFMTLLAAFDVLLARHTGQEDIVVGTANGNRALVETERMLGLFVNTIVLRTDLSGDPTFRELLARVRTVGLEAYAHGDLPFEKLVEELRPPRDLSRSPIFQVLFVIQNTPLAALVRRGASGVIGERGTAAYDLSLYLIETGQGLVGSLEYSTDLFARATAERLCARYQYLLAGIVAHPESRISELPLLGTDEQRRLREWNDTERTVADAGAHDLFAAQARRNPEAIAVVCGDEEWTYERLDRQADRLAWRLRELGVRPGVLVGLHAERSLRLMVGLLGILKAGGAYVPLDPAYPRQRLASMVEDARPAVVLTEAHLAEGLPPSAAHVLLLEEMPGQGLAREGPPKGGAGPEDLAYVIFTSGSTGRPKGVAVPHRALSNLLASMGESPGLSSSDVLLAVTTLAFDIAALELFLPLTVGARVVLASHEEASDGRALARLLSRSGATVMQATPVTWRLLIASGWSGDSNLKVLCGGEALPGDLARELRARCGSLWNVYGPTETTIWSTVHAVHDPEGAVPVGRPIANTWTYVLDRHLRPVPIGVPGELYIGGTGLAWGYLGRPALTAESFVPDPFGRSPGSRLYRTGDRARFRGDGVLECLGRIDNQVKVRGFRIEPGEIEAALRELPGVQDCAVVAREEATGDKRLVAYVVAGPAGAPSPAQSRALLKQRLPGYMIPAAFVELPALPLTPNGKVDRRALPAPEGEGRAIEAPYVPPRGPVEEALAQMCREVLGLERVGAHDSFFDLGGHSLSATQVLARIQDAFQVQIPLRRIFEAPTIAGLASSVEAALGEGVALDDPRLVPVARDGELPLSFAQERLWFLDRLEEGDPVYNIPGALYFKGRIDETALERSLAEVVRRHESLRTTFGDVEGRPVQRIGREGFVLDRADLSELPEEERATTLRRLMAEEARRPFDLAQGPVFRGRLLRLRVEEHVLMLTVHHIAADGWSLGVLIREMGALYAAFSRGEPSSLPELPVQYADYARWQREWLSGQRLQTQLAYWTGKLSAIPTLNLPLDRARPPLQTFRGAMHHFQVDGPLGTRLRELARRERATLFMALMSVFQTLLHRYAGQTDVAVGTPVAGRRRTELEGLVGLFANTLVLRTDFSGDPSFREVLARVRESSLEAYTHQEMPFEKLVEALRPPRNLSAHPLFQVMFVLQNAPARPLELPGVGLGSVGVETGTSRFDLTLFVTDTPRGFLGTLEYNTDIFDPGTMERLALHFRTLLEAVVQDPDRRVADLPLLTPSERTQMVRGWNDTARPVPGESLHQWIASQAARTPDRVAVGFDGETLTYLALDRRANQLAHRLRTLGVGPEVLVGIGLERSPEMVVALLATLKAGGAYLPLDPAYPPERLAYMVEDARIRVLLTQESLRGSMPAGGAHILCVDTEREGLSRESDTALPELVTGEDLAYVIYTSGSTGRPKGVQVPHRALVNLLAAMAERPGLRPEDTLLSVTTLSFDIAGLELFLPLVVGGRVELVDRDTAVDGRELAQRLSRTGATVMQATPATWRLLLEAGWTGASVTALCGGEALAGDLIEALLPRTASLWNLYGPTETTIWSAVHQVQAAEPVAALGRPIANTEIYILDAHLQPVPAGVSGELYIGGAGVARGYRERPDLTAERFLPDPFAPTAGARFYRTGDLARYRPDGTIDFLGRVDNQVKVRGFRIELGEIETALRELEAVSLAVVVARDAGAGSRQLGAYLILGPGQEATITELRSDLKKRLPAYMIPSSFVVLDALPLTPNGKVDRKALARLEGRPDEAAAAPVEPRTPTERLVAEAWREALGVERISVHDNFFDLGGHSLLSMRVLARLERGLGVRLNPRDMIFQTLEQLAAMGDERTESARKGATKS